LQVARQTVDGVVVDARVGCNTDRVRSFIEVARGQGCARSRDQLITPLNLSGLLLLLLLLLQVRLCAHRAVFFARDLGCEEGNPNGVRRDGARGRRQMIGLVEMLCEQILLGCGEYLIDYFIQTGERLSITGVALERLVVEV
jgi:hypothetical protein